MMENTGSPESQPSACGEPALKTISYRGGLVTFRIPTHWREEYEPKGGGTFYEDAPDSPTFRLQILTMQSPSPVSAESAPDVLRSLQKLATVSVEQLPSGCSLIRYTKSVEEHGEQLLITFWSVAHVVPPYHVRIANFSYTLLEPQRDDAGFQRELELLDREVRASIFSPELGVLDSKN